MADDRPLELPEEAIGRIDGKLADVESTLLARVAAAVAEARRRPTGTVEMALRTSAQEGTLLLQGQTVNRADYPDLWAHAQAQGLVTAGVFTAGNGTTTFGLPDWRGRTPVGVQAGGDIATLGAEVGASTRTLTVANLPVHKHSVAVTVQDVGTHSHALTTGQGGAHNGHFPGERYYAAAGADYGFAAWDSGGASSGTHSHSGGVQSDGGHGHNSSTSEQNVGSGAAFDNRPPLKACNYIIWT